MIEREKLNNADIEVRKKITHLKQKKATGKSLFTKTRHKFLELLQEHLQSRNEVKQFRQKLENQLQEIMNLLTQLSSVFMEVDDTIAQIGIAD